MTKQRKGIISLLIILLGVAAMSLNCFAANEYLMTVICQPNCEYTQYDIVNIRLVNTNNKNSYSRKLYAYNNFSDKYYLPEGHYVVSEISMEGRENAIFQTGYKEFDLDSNKIITIELVDSGVIATTAVPKTTIPQTTTKKTETTKSETTTQPSTEPDTFTIEDNTTNFNFIDQNVTAYYTQEEITAEETTISSNTIKEDELTSAEKTTSENELKREKLAKTATKIGIASTCVAGLIVFMFVGFIVYSRRKQ